MIDLQYIQIISPPASSLTHFLAFSIFPSLQEIGLWTDFEYTFHFANNLLTGTLPTSLFSLTKLRSGFYLYKNSLVGTLPTEFGLMTLLSSFVSVYGNSFTGQLP